MRKNFVAVASSITCAFLLTSLVQVAAQPIPVATPLPTPMPIGTASPAPTPTVSAASPSPAATAKVSPTPTPHRSATPKAVFHDPDLSGHVDYTFDTSLIRDNLKQIGVDTVPAHYRPLMELHVAGIELFSLTRENDTHNTSIQIMAMQDPSEFVAKMRALKRMHLDKMVNPMASAKEPNTKCMQPTGYTVGSVKVRKLSCRTGSALRVLTEYATLIVSGKPINLYMHTTAAIFEDQPMRQLIKEISATTSIFS